MHLQVPSLSPLLCLGLAASAAHSHFRTRVRIFTRVCVEGSFIYLYSHTASHIYITKMVQTDIHYIKNFKSEKLPDCCSVYISLQQAYAHYSKLFNGRFVLNRYVSTINYIFVMLYFGVKRTPCLEGFSVCSLVLINRLGQACLESLPVMI